MLTLGLTVLAAQVAVSGDAIAQKRHALVIATSNYDHLRRSSIRLDTIKRTSEALRRQGFAVTTAFDQRSSVIRAKLTTFAREIGKDDFVLFLLAGHLASKPGVAIYLPKEMRARSSRDILLRGLPSSTFLRLAGRAKRGLVLWLTSDPNLPPQFKWLLPYPQPMKLEESNVAIAFSGSSKVPISQLDRIAQLAAGRLAAVAEKGFDDGRQLVTAVATRKYGLVLGGDQDIKLAPVLKSVPVTDPANVRLSANDTRDQNKNREPSERRAETLPGVGSSALSRQFALLESDRRSQRAAREQAERRAKAARDRAQEAERKARDADTRARKALDDKLLAERKAQREQAAKSQLAEELARKASAADALRKKAEQELAEARQRAKQVSKAEGAYAAASKAREAAEQRATAAATKASDAEERAGSAEAKAKLALKSKLDAENAVLAQRSDNVKLTKEIARYQALAEKRQRDAEQDLAKALQLEEKLALAEVAQKAEASARKRAEEQAVEAAKKAKDAEERARTAESRRRGAEENLANALKLEEKLALAEVAQKAEASARKRAEEQAVEAAQKAKDAEERARTAETKLKELEATKLASATDARTLKLAAERRKQATEEAAKASQQRLQETQAALDALKARAAKLAGANDQAKRENEARRVAEQSAAARSAEAEKRAQEAETSAKRAAEREQAARTDAANKAKRLAELQQQILKIQEQQRVARAEMARKAATAPSQAGVVASQNGATATPGWQDNTQQQAAATKVTAEPSTGPAPRKPITQPQFKVAILKRIEARFSRDQKKRIQTKLRTKGYLSGKVRTSFGRKTRAAIRKFQTAVKTKPTGYLTPFELRELLSN